MPTDAEWKSLEMYLGMSQATANLAGWRGADEGSKRAGNAVLWTDSVLNQNAVFETSGFTALPGGHRGNDKTFGNIGVYGRWWSATEYDNNFAWYRSMHYGFIDLSRVYDRSKEIGFSVRCFKD